MDFGVEENELLAEEIIQTQDEFAFKSETNTPEPTVEKVTKNQPDFEQMEAVMTKGMEFLTDLFQMSTRQNFEKRNKPKVKVDKETGEVSISFKMIN